MLLSTIFIGEAFGFVVLWHLLIKTLEVQNENRWFETRKVWQYETRVYQERAHITSFLG